MRQQLAAWTAALCLSTVTLLALVVARRLDAGVPAVPVAVAGPGAAVDTVPHGRAVFDSLGCATCHSVAGEGNVRNPLDGLAARMEPARVRAWIVGDASVADSLPPSAFRRKQAYATVGEGELAELVGYLLGLPAG